MINVLLFDGEWEVWTDTGPNYQDGRCLATGSTKLAAMKDALAELESDLASLRSQQIDAEEAA